MNVCGGARQGACTCAGVRSKIDRIIKKTSDVIAGMMV